MLGNTLLSGSYINKRFFNPVSGLKLNVVQLSLVFYLFKYALRYFSNVRPINFDLQSKQPETPLTVPTLIKFLVLTLLP